MRKIIRYFLFLLFLMVINLSCEKLVCKTCKLITIIDGNRTEGPGIIYCGEKLEEKENMEPVEIVGGISFYECN